MKYLSDNMYSQVNLNLDIAELCISPNYCGVNHETIKFNYTQKIISQ